MVEYGIVPLSLGVMLIFGIVPLRLGVNSDYSSVPLPLGVIFCIVLLSLGVMLEKNVLYLFL